MEMVAHQLAKHMQIQLAKRMEMGEDCSTDECPTHQFVPLRFGVYCLFFIMKIIIIDAFFSF